MVYSSTHAGRRRLVRRLFREGATSAWSARGFEPRNDRERRALEEAVAMGLLVRTEAGTYFVNPERYEARCAQNRWAVIVAVAAILIGLAVLYLTGEFSS